MSSATSWVARYFGPKPIRSASTALFVGLIILLVLTGALVNAERAAFDGISLRSLLAALPLALIGAVVTGLVLRVFRALQVAKPHLGWVFYAAIVSAAVAVVVSRQLIVSYTELFIFESPAWNTAGNQVGFGVILVILMFTLLQLVGAATHRLEAENNRANRALAELERQQQLLVASQEQVRAELARYLHDGLQSNLLVLGLQVQQAIQQLPKGQQAIGQSFLDEIERIRAVDVRLAIRELSPDLEGLTLESALRELFRRFEPVMAVGLTLAGGADSNRLDTRLKTGVYRIIEQALQNALAHGAASRAAVSITLTADQLALTVSNDGKPVSADHVRGSGLAVVEAWCGLLGGSYELAPVASGSTFSARLLNGSEGQMQNSAR